MKCEICGSDKFVDAHHYDCKEGKISSETINLCRRCHRTYHDRGIEWFDDEFIDKAIEIENKFRVIHNTTLQRKESVSHRYIDGLYDKELQPTERGDIIRSDYWNKIHGISKRRQPPKETKDERQAGFAFIDNLMRLK